MPPDNRERRPRQEGGAQDAANVTHSVTGAGDFAPNLRRKVTLPDAQVHRLADLVRAAMSEAGPLVAERRERVLAHPDLAARLTEEPVGYERPEQWNGYVPPLTWNGQFNDSPRRAALAEICAEALRRHGGDCPALDVT